MHSVTMTIEQQPTLEGQSRSVIEKVSPLVRRIADRMNFDLGGLSGTGSEGQITVNDLMHNWQTHLRLFTYWFVSYFLQILPKSSILQIEQN